MNMDAKKRKANKILANPIQQYKKIKIIQHDQVREARLAYDLKMNQCNSPYL